MHTHSYIHTHISTNIDFVHFLFLHVIFCFDATLQEPVAFLVGRSFVPGQRFVSQRLGALRSHALLVSSEPSHHDQARPGGAVVTQW